MSQRVDRQFVLEEERIRVGLRWSCSSPKVADLDLSCILLDEYANIANVIHYNKLRARGVHHSGDDRVGLPVGLRDGYNEMIDLDLAELSQSDIVCVIIYVSCYHGTALKDCKNGRVQVKHITDSEFDDENQHDSHHQSATKPQDHLFIYETLLKTKSRYSGLVPYMFLYDQEESKWEMLVLNEWIADSHFLDGFAKVLNRKVLPNRVWQPLCERLEHKILETLNKEKRLHKKHQAVNRKRQNTSGTSSSSHQHHGINDGKAQQDRQHIMNITIINEIRDLINPDKQPYVLDPTDQQIILHPNNKQLQSNYPSKKTIEDKDQIVNDSEEEDLDSFESSPKKPATKKINFPTFELNSDVDDIIELGMGWQAKQGHLRSQYYLSANMIMFGKYGHKISFVDQRTSSKVRGCTYYPTEYRKSGKTDRVLTVRLKDVEQNVTSVVFVVIASSTTEFHGFSDLKNPYVRLSIKESVELFKYGFPDEATRAHSNYYSLIAFKLTRVNGTNNKWKLAPIAELSEGTHGLFHPKLRSQISRHIDRLPEPERFSLISKFAKRSGASDNRTEGKVKSSYTFSSKEFATIGIDFTCVKNIKEIACFEIGKYGDIKNARLLVVNEKQDLTQRKMSIQMSGLSYVRLDEKAPEMLISATSFLRYNLDKLCSDGVSHVVWVLTFNEWIADDPLDNDRCIIDSDWSNIVRAWNINDRNALCSCSVSNVYNVDGNSDYNAEVNGTLIAKLSHTGDNSQAPWSLSCVDEIIPFKSRLNKYNDSKRIKQTRYLKGIEPYLEIPKVTDAKVLYGSKSQDTIVAPYELESITDLLIGVGVEGSKPIHLLDVNVELYNSCGSYVSDLNENSNKFKTLQFHPFRQQFLPTGYDSEQFSILRSIKSPVRHYAITAQAISRSYLKSSDVIYVRVCQRQTCRELLRINCEASPFLVNSSGKKADLDEVVTVTDLSDDEDSDCGSQKDEGEARVLLALITFTQKGWKVLPAGRIVNEEQFYKYFIPPAPTHLRMEVLEASDVKPTDKSGTSNPYIKLKLVDALKNKKKKAQKFITKTQHKTLSPKFNETFEFAIDSPDDVVKFEMLDHDGPIKMRHNSIGIAKLSVYDALSNQAEEVVTTIGLVSADGKLAAKLKLRTSRVWK